MKRKKTDGTRLVYSTAKGRVCPVCGEAIADCKCRKTENRAVSGDSVVRVRREVKGRKGKTVTTVTGVPLSADALSALAANLKKKCGTGGSVKDGVIIIQGDHRQKLLPLLENEGFTVKLAGG